MDSAGSLIVARPRSDRVRWNSGEWLRGHGRSYSRKWWYSGGRSLTCGVVSRFRGEPDFAFPGLDQENSILFRVVVMGFGGPVVIR